MAKMLSVQIEDLENENQRLKNLEKIIEKIVRNEFGISSKEIHKLIKNNRSTNSIFVSKISDFFELETDQDFMDFIDIFCTEDFISYYQDKLNSESNTEPQPQ